MNKMFMVRQPKYSQLFEKTKVICEAVDLLNLERLELIAARTRAIKHHCIYQSCPRCKELGAFFSTRWLDKHLLDHRIERALGTEQKWVDARNKKRKQNLKKAAVAALAARKLKKLVQ